MRPVKLIVASLAFVAAALIATLLYQSGSSLARSLNQTHLPRMQGVAPQAPPRSTPSFGEAPRGELGRAMPRDDGTVTEADGALPDGAPAPVSA
jgi:hypothetical protein